MPWTSQEGGLAWYKPPSGGGNQTAGLYYLLVFAHLCTPIWFFYELQDKHGGGGESHLCSETLSIFI